MSNRLRATVLIGAAAGLIVVGAVSAWWLGSGRFSRITPPERQTARPDGKRDGEGAAPKAGPAVKTVAENLAVPWALAFLSNGDLLFTERAGNVKLLEKDGKGAALLRRIPGVAAEGEGGLLGVAVHPDYAKNRFIYLYYTYRAQGRLQNRVVRYKLQDSKLVEDKIIVDKIPGSDNHNGGRIKFGPDGLLYVTAGDSQEPDLAQNRKSLAGKILRFEGDGSVPAQNPFPGSPVYSLGHRNPQGLAWDGRGRLWATEHGASGNDEVNLIEPGKNYGWPIIEGDAYKPGLEKPVVHSDGGTWAPSGAAFLNGSIFFAGLRGQALFKLNTGAPAAPPQSFFSGDFGRLRDVVVGPDGRPYIATNNSDGRGIPGLQGDRIIKIDPGRL